MCNICGANYNLTVKCTPFARKLLKRGIIDRVIFYKPLLYCYGIQSGGKTNEGLRHPFTHAYRKKAWRA